MRKGSIAIFALFIAVLFIAQTASVFAYGGGGSAASGIISSRRNKPQGEVLGASTTQATTTNSSTTKFMFLNDLGLGMQHSDVVELQNRLKAEGFFTFSTSTGYFGPITMAAVKAYQTAHGISFVTGFVGPLTRAELNKNTSPVTMSIESEGMIEDLKNKVQSLLTLSASL